jgi:hypothetical protein
MFAFSENMIFMFLSLMTPLPREEAAALLNGLKIDACCSAIRRLFEARKQNIPEQIEDCLSRLVTINTFRNNILHWGVDMMGMARNHVKVVPGREVEFMVSKEDLDFATTDLLKISEILSSYHGMHRGDPEGMKRSQATIAGPWLYKPSQPKNTRQQNRSTSQTLKRPQKSSPK